MWDFIKYLIYCVSFVFYMANGGIVNGVEHPIVDMLVGFIVIAILLVLFYFVCWIYATKIRPKISLKKNDDSDVDHQEDKDS